MIQGIAVLGLNGGGKITISHALAKRLGYFDPKSFAPKEGTASVD